MAKIINSSKLLPSTKSTAIVKVGKTNILAKTTPLSKGLLATRQSKDATDANNKLVKIDKFLKSDLIVSKKKAEVKRKDTEKQDFAEAEKKLELPKFRGLKLPGISAPSLGFMDRVKRFIFFTALGWALPKILEFLPKLQGFANIIGGVYQFAEGLFGKLFDGFMSLVKFGGDLKDKTLGFIATAKAGVGGNYQKEFDKLEKQFNTFVNASIIAGVLAADIGSAAVDEYNKQKNRGGGGGSGYKAGYAAGYAAGLASRGGRPRRPGEAAAGGTLAENVGRQKLSRERMLKPEGPKGPLDRVRRGFRGAAAQLQTGTLFPKGAGVQKAIYNAPGKIKNLPKKIPAFWNKIFKGPFAKLKGPLSRFAGAAVPGLGAAVGAADAAARFKAGDKIGGALASVSSGLDAITTVLALTGVGLPAAAIFGGVSIGIDVILLIRDIAKAFFPFIPMFSRGGRVVRRYQGGGTTRGGRPVGAPKRRAITPVRRKPTKLQTPKSKPGKDVGGEKKIKEFYSKKMEPSDPDYYKALPLSTILANLGGGVQKLNEKPYKALTTTAKILKEIPLVGGIMGAAVDIALGQKPDTRIYRSLSSGIGYLVESLANQRVNTSVTSLMKDIKGFAEGGKVPISRQLNDSSGSMNSGDLISKVLGPTIDQRVNEAIQSIQKEVQKMQQKKEQAPGQLPGPNDVPGARLRDGSNAQIEADLLEYYTALYGKNAAIGIVANLRRESGYRTATPDNSSYEGMAQWSRSDRWPKFVKWAENKGLNPYDRNAQAQYVSVELKQLGTDKRIAQAKSAEEAASIFYNEFERGAYSKPVKGNSYNPDNPHENKNKTFIQDISGRNPDIGKRIDKVVIRPLTPSGQYTVSEVGTKISGDLGDFMKAWGGVPGSIWQHSRHGGQGRRNYPSYHNVDRAIDLGANANEQGPILKKIEEFNKLKGVRPVQLLHAGNDPSGGHDDHVHVAYQGGGFISPRKPNRAIPNSFAPYETYGSGMMIAIQPIIVEKQVPVSGGGKMIAFPVPVAVNSNMDNLSFSRG